MKSITLFVASELALLLFLLVLITWSNNVSGSFVELDCKHSTWLHVPKTASSFCLTLQHACCEEEFVKATQSVTEAQLELFLNSQTQDAKNINFTFDVAYGCAYFKHYRDGYTGCLKQPRSKGSHSPLPVSINLEEVSVIAMFREPKARILSSFLDSRHHEGMSVVEFKALQKKIDEAAPEEDNITFEKLLLRLSVYASHPHMMGCQVKMVMGYECSAPLNLSFSSNRSFVDRAVDRMNRFFFVGLTDYYNISVDLFHRISNHSVHASIVEKVPVRVNRLQKEEESLYQMFHYHDPIDDYFYQKAKDRFFSDVKVHDIKVRGFHHRLSIHSPSTDTHSHSSRK